MVWFVCFRLELGSVIDIDNVPYHSHRAEPLFTSQWKKAKMFNPLKSKDLTCKDTMLTPELFYPLRGINLNIYKISNRQNEKEVSLL